MSTRGVRRLPRPMSLSSRNHPQVRLTTCPRKSRSFIRILTDQHDLRKHHVCYQLCSARHHKVCCSQAGRSLATIQAECGRRSIIRRGKLSQIVPTLVCSLSCSSMAHTSLPANIKLCDTDGICSATLCLPRPPLPRTRRLTLVAKAVCCRAVHHPSLVPAPSSVY